MDMVHLFAITDFGVDEEVEYFADQVLYIVGNRPWYFADPRYTFDGRQI